MSNICQNKKYHFIYKTTNLLNETFYYGMHSTSNLKDGYLGSGKRLKYSIQKHGIENFKFEILEFLPDRETLIAKEIELITEEMLQHPLCMNLKPGGAGGFCNKEHMMKCSNAGHIGFRKKSESDEKFKKDFSEKMNANLSKVRKPWNETFSWTGRKQSETHKQNFKASIQGKQKGSLNSQFGFRWVQKDNEIKKIKLDELDFYLSIGWIKGRKLINT